MEVLTKASVANICLKNGRKKIGYLFNGGEEKNEYKFLCNSRTKQFLTTYDGSLIETLEVSAIESIDFILK